MYAKKADGGGLVTGIFSFLAVFAMLASATITTVAGEDESGDAEWSVEIVDTGQFIGSYSSLALDGSDNPHISYYDQANGNLKYARKTGSEWEIYTVDHDYAGIHTSLALDSKGYPHISYIDENTHTLKYAKWTGSDWSIETLDPGNDATSYTSLAIDGNDDPHMSFYGENTTKPDPLAPNQFYFDLKYARWTGSAWEFESIDTAGMYFSRTSIVLDGEGNPYISYTSVIGSSDLKCARRTGSTWSIEIVDQFGGGYSSIDLDSNDDPHISYFDRNYYYPGFGGNDLKYAKWDGSAWSTQTVDSAGDVGLDTSIALDINDESHISYSDPDDRELKYAKWTETAWDIEVVDSNGYSPNVTSIALDSNGNPHISYRGQNGTSASSLRYASLAPAAPTDSSLEGGSLGSSVFAGLIPILLLMIVIVMALIAALGIARLRRGKAEHGSFSELAVQPPQESPRIKR
jgi:hypothetical protein